MFARRRIFGETQRKFARLCTRGSVSEGPAAVCCVRRAICNTSPLAPDVCFPHMPQASSIRRSLRTRPALDRRRRRREPAPPPATRRPAAPPASSSASSSASSATANASASGASAVPAAAAAAGPRVVAAAAAAAAAAAIMWSWWSSDDQSLQWVARTTQRSSLCGNAVLIFHSGGSACLNDGSRELHLEHRLCGTWKRDATAKSILRESLQTFGLRSELEEDNENRVKQNGNKPQTPLPGLHRCKRRNEADAAAGCCCSRRRIGQSTGRWP